SLRLELAVHMRLTAGKVKHIQNPKKTSGVGERRLGNPSPAPDPRNMLHRLNNDYSSVFAASAAACSAARAWAAATRSASMRFFSAIAASRSASFSLRVRELVFSLMRADLPRRSRR